MLNEKIPKPLYSEGKEKKKGFQIPTCLNRVEDSKNFRKETFMWFAQKNSLVDTVVL